MEGLPTNHNDIGYFCNKIESLTADQKYDICTTVRRPDAKCVFPESVYSGKNRKFSFSWLEDHTWLQYSTVLDCAFCLPCMMFGHQTTVNPSKVEKLVVSPCRDWSCAVARLRMHMKSGRHQTASLTMQTFLGVKQNKIVSIDRIYNKAVNDNNCSNI